MAKLHVIAALALLSSGASVANAQNLIPTHWSSISRPFGEGILRSGSGWDAGSTPSDVLTLVDGVLAPESQQWNTGSYWWDETQTVSPFQTTLALNGSYTFNRLVLQADNNDDYLIEYWTGSAWQTAFMAGAVGGYGLTTRDSGTLAAFTTNEFRFTALNGDAYYAMSEFQAFAAGVPEPASWALMLGGFGAIGGAMRARRKATATFA
jgi:hypothetical protein